MSRQMRRNAPEFFISIDDMYAAARADGFALPVNRAVRKFIPGIAFEQPFKHIAGVITSAWVPMALTRPRTRLQWNAHPSVYWRMPSIDEMSPDTWMDWVSAAQDEGLEEDVRPVERDPFYNPIYELVQATYQTSAEYRFTCVRPQDAGWPGQTTRVAQWFAAAFTALTQISRGTTVEAAAKASWWCTLLRMSGPDATNGYEELAQQHVRMLKGDEMPTSYPLSGSMLEPRSEWVDGIPEWAFIPGPGVPLWDIPVRRKFAERAFGEDYMIVYDRMVTRWAQSKGLMRRNGRWRR